MLDPRCIPHTWISFTWVFSRDCVLHLKLHSWIVLSNFLLLMTFFSYSAKININFHQVFFWSEGEPCYSICSKISSNLLVKSLPNGPIQHIIGSANNILPVVSSSSLHFFFFIHSPSQRLLFLFLFLYIARILSWTLWSNNLFKNLLLNCHPSSTGLLSAGLPFSEWSGGDLWLIILYCFYPIWQIDL